MYLMHQKHFRNKTIFIWHTIDSALFNGLPSFLYFWVQTFLIDWLLLIDYALKVFFRQLCLILLLVGKNNFIRHEREGEKNLYRERLFFFHHHFIQWQLFSILYKLRFKLQERRTNCIYCAFLSTKHHAVSKEKVDCVWCFNH